jgi:hypothetical protein
LNQRESINEKYSSYSIYSASIKPEYYFNDSKRIIMKIRKLPNSILLLNILTVLSCNQDKIADYGFKDPEPEEKFLNFNGIDSIDSITDSTATIKWTHKSAYSRYKIYSILDKKPSLIASVESPTSEYNLSMLSKSSSYTFRVRGIDINGKIDTNTNDVSINTKSAPDTPTELSLSPSSDSYLYTRTPTISITGVKSGDTIRLFTDANCQMEIGSVVSTGANVDITLPFLSAGSYTFYANASGESTSPCSSANASYIQKICPNGYISVPPNESLAVAKFCIMKYEAKAWNDLDKNKVPRENEVDTDGCNESNCTTANWGIATHMPISLAYGHPWRKINQTNSWDECDSLNTEISRSNIDNDFNKDGTYALVSNPEWMAVARNIESVATNWTSGKVGSGCLFRGNAGGEYPCEGINSSYNAKGPDSGLLRGDNKTASLFLSNGEEIRDFSGNVSEWVDWDLSSNLATINPSEKAYVSSDGTPLSKSREFKDLDSNISDSDKMFPNSWQAKDIDLSKVNGIGQYLAGKSSSGGAALRGGSWTTGASTGLYSLHLNYSSKSTSSAGRNGFRCVYRPWNQGF